MITLFKDFAIKGEVPRRNVIEAQRSLDQIPPQLTSSQHDAYYQIFEFVSTAIEFYKFWYTYLCNESNTPEAKNEKNQKRPVSASPIAKNNYSSVTKYQSNDNYAKTYYSSVASNQNTTQASLEKNYSSVTSDKKYSPILGYFEDNLQKSNESLKKIGEKRKGLEERVISLQKGSQLDMKTPTRNLNQSFDRFGSCKNFDPKYSTASIASKNTQNSTSPQKKVQFTPGDTKNKKEATNLKNPIAIQLNYEQEINEAKKEAKEYKSRVGKMLAEHDRHVIELKFFITNR